MFVTDNRDNNKFLEIKSDCHALLFQFPKTCTHHTNDACKQSCFETQRVVMWKAVLYAVGVVSEITALYYIE